MEIYANFLWFPYLYTEFTHIAIAASNTASGDATNRVTHWIFNTDLLYTFSHFIVKIDENLALMTFVIRFNDATW